MGENALTASDFYVKLVSRNKRKYIFGTVVQAAVSTIVHYYIKHDANEASLFVFVLIYIIKGGVGQLFPYSCMEKR
ncbi:hypothetical protein N0O92_14380 [Alkalihalobacillus sp. MEB130]|uniref:hypothetical protein n=1 Tax=Alkalihalobacillus sp. MEB130 TaxID=2976704 RepID=UPI0028DF3E4D|nr:hypothetical protein [Alkalihalobacillus sp. MEB130]MDT8861405.1 hypothetical protein [Alkalihalobacillus sp. MEB130]